MLTIAGGILLAVAILYASVAIWDLITLKIYEHRYAKAIEVLRREYSVARSEGEG